MKHFVKTQLTIEKHGSLIGTGGSTIQKLEASSGAKIKLPRKDDEDPSIKVKIVQRCLF